MIMRKGIYLIVMCLSFIFGCQAKNGFTSVDAKTFAVEIAKPQVQLVDVRTAEEYQQGHIPAAVNIDVNSPDFDSRIAELDKGRSVALYCRSGRRSKIAAARVVELGFKVVELDGGVLSWQGELEQ